MRIEGRNVINFPFREGLISIHKPRDAADAFP
ncbi:MAG: hypothetical protein ACI9E1_002174 [Cryomorphaceae bacterium]|jgi:hypothetical protein